MTQLAPNLERFFTVHLIQELNASRHAVLAYRDTWSILLAYLQKDTGTPPNHLDLSAFTSSTIGGFLTYLEEGRGNSIRTRNARLAAIQTFFSDPSSRAFPVNW
jgi:integrase/recombinase XerD